MSRNIGSTTCNFCISAVTLDEAPRPIKREEAGPYYATGRDGYGYAGGIFANATCTRCSAKYLAWIDLSACDGYGRHRNWGDKGQPFFDLSYRSTFNDEPGEEDLPDWKLDRVELTAEQCMKLEAIAGMIVRRRPWPRCEKTGRKVYHCYGCPCDEHR
jgi:hypothetical protein